MNKELDNLTPVFQAKMYSLSRQQRKIVDLLSQYNDGLVVKEIAMYCFITDQTASSQLHKLKEEGVVKSTTNGRESTYKLSDPKLQQWLKTRVNNRAK